MKIKPQRPLEEYYVLEFFFRTGNKPDYEKWCKTISVHGLSPLKIEKVVKYADGCNQPRRGNKATVRAYEVTGKKRKYMWNVTLYHKDPMSIYDYVGKQLNALLGN